MIRIGIIGLGWWGKQIVSCLAESPRFKVVAGCDIDGAMAAPFAAARNFELTDDYKALLKRPDVDAIAVVTPHLLHEEMAIAAFAAGTQVFCEKPLALTAASAERILGACAKAGGVLGIGHERRYETAMEEMRPIGFPPSNCWQISAFSTRSRNRRPPAASQLRLRRKSFYRSRNCFLIALHSA